jgi:hypothetical protein
MPDLELLRSKFVPYLWGSNPLTGKKWDIFGNCKVAFYERIQQQIRDKTTGTTRKIRNNQDHKIR